MPIRKGKAADFGEWLDVTMSNQGISGRTLAEVTGVHDSAVSRWRSGTAVPSMDSIERMASTLGVEALRLAVTAGVVSPKVAGLEPLPMPVPTARRESVKRQLANLRGVTDEERRLLLQAYEDAIHEETEQ
jgi:transcriptional regulator with XRE-family HTH domain